MDKSSVKMITSSETNDREWTSSLSSSSRRFCSRLCTRCHLNIRQDEVILRAKHFIFHLDCFTCVTCHQHLHPGDEFGLKDESIFCRQHFFEQQQQQQQSYDPSAFLDDSGYYTSPLPNLTAITTTSQTPTTTPSSVKRTRKRKDRCQTQTHDDLISSSSEHFLALSPSSSSNLGKNLIARRS